MLSTTPFHTIFLTFYPFPAHAGCSRLAPRRCSDRAKPRRPAVARGPGGGATDRGRLRSGRGGVTTRRRGGFDEACRRRRAAGNRARRRARTVRLAAPPARYGIPVSADVLARPANALQQCRNKARPGGSTCRDGSADIGAAAVSRPAPARSRLAW